MNITMMKIITRFWKYFIYGMVTIGKILTKILLLMMIKRIVLVRSVRPGWIMNG